MASAKDQAELTTLKTMDQPNHDVARKVRPSLLKRIAAVGVLVMCVLAVVTYFICGTEALYADVVVSPLQLLAHADSAFRWPLIILWVAGITGSVALAMRTLCAKKPVKQRFALITLAIVLVVIILTNLLVPKCVDVCPDVPGLYCIIGVKCFDRWGEIIFCLIFVAMLVVLALPNIIEELRAVRQKRKAYLRSLNNQSR